MAVEKMTGKLYLIWAKAVIQNDSSCFLMFFIIFKDPESLSPLLTNYTVYVFLWMQVAQGHFQWFKLKCALSITNMSLRSKITETRTRMRWNDMKTAAETHWHSDGVCGAAGGRRRWGLAWIFRKFPCRILGQRRRNGEGWEIRMWPQGIF